jgi:hypothetical protein
VEILKRLKRPTTKYALVADVSKQDATEVVSRLTALVRSGQVKTRRVYSAGSGYITYYQVA